jgi:hypothetical protein
MDVDLGIVWQPAKEDTLQLLIWTEGVIDVTQLSYKSLQKRIKFGL